MDKSLGSTTTTAMNSGVPDISFGSSTLDVGGSSKERVVDYPDWPRNLAYFEEVAEYNSAILALARWTVGLGFETDTRTKVILDNITGWGEDSFQSILQNMIIIKKVNGDAFAEIIRDDETGSFINLKPLNPETMRTIVDTKGIIIRYEEWDKKKRLRKFETNKILHLCNNRIGNQIRGYSTVKPIKWVIDARNEAMSDWRRISHRSTIRVLHIDSEDTARLTTVKEQYKEAIKNGEVLILPGKPGETELSDFTLPTIDPFIQWIRYLEGFFYQVLGVPKVIANSSDFTEAGSKIGFLTFEPVYSEEQTLLEQDLWNQIAIKVKFRRPPSLSGVTQENEKKNSSQTGFQPTDTTATAGRVE